MDMNEITKMKEITEIKEVRRDMKKMLTIGEQLPDFNLKGVKDNTGINFPSYTKQSHKGKWSIFVFYPKDFTFICPTELTGYNDLYDQFQEQNSQVYGVSTDSEFVHRAWRNDHQEIGKLRYPLLSDIKKEFSEAIGILDVNEGVCLRATVIADPEGSIMHISVNGLNVGRNPAETLRVLQALQAGDLTGCNWQPGDSPVAVA